MKANTDTAPDNSGIEWLPNDNARITIRLPKHIKDDLDTRAEEEGILVNDLMNRIIKEEIDKIKLSPEEEAEIAERIRKRQECAAECVGTGNDGTISS